MFICLIYSITDSKTVYNSTTLSISGNSWQEFPTISVAMSRHAKEGMKNFKYQGCNNWGEDHSHDPVCNEMTSCQPWKISQKPLKGRTPRKHVHYNKVQDPKSPCQLLQKIDSWQLQHSITIQIIFKKWHHLTAAESSGNNVFRIHIVSAVMSQ